MPTKIKYEPALEAVFAATNTEKILKTLEDRVNSIDDIGALDELRQQFSIESEIFNKIIGNMLEAGERYKSNQITLEELAQIVKPYNEELKKKVTMLDLQEAEGSDYKLEDEEIAQLRAVLMGATEIIGQRRAAIQGPSGDEETAPFEGTDEEFEAAESFISSLKNFMIPTTKKNGLGNLKAAVEAFSGRVLRSSEAKTAKTTMKEAKAALRRKDLKNATALYKRAKSEWNTVLKAIDKLIVDKTGKAPAGSKIKEESMEKIKRKITHCDEMLAKIKELAEKIKNGTVKKAASESSIGVSALLDLISPALESDDGDDDDDDKDDDSDDDDEPAEESLTNIINEFNNHRKFKK